MIRISLLVVVHCNLFRVGTSSRVMTMWLGWIQVLEGLEATVQHFQLFLWTGHNETLLNDEDESLAIVREIHASIRNGDCY